MGTSPPDTAASRPPGANATRSGAGPSDAALVVAARAGEEWAAEALFRRYARSANGLAFRLLGRDADVDDLVQDSFVDALGGLCRLREPEAFAAWLRAIIVRRSTKVLRKRRLLSRLGIRSADPPIDLDALASHQAPPDVAVELRATYATVARLPVELRVALVLRRIEAMSLEEIATLTHTSLATVKRRLARAEAELEAALRDQEGSP